MLANAVAGLAFLQVLCSTYFLRIEGFFYVNSILFLLAGVAISICLLFFTNTRIEAPFIINKQSGLKAVAVALLLPLSYFFSRRIMDGTPLQIEYADMLPIMKVMSTRFLHGDLAEVYQPIPGIWNGITPIYLPALWLPFTAAVVFDFDMRWITVCGIWMSVLFVLLPLWRTMFFRYVIPFALLILLAWFHSDKINNVIRLTEEGVIFFYFSLMTVALFLRNPWLIGITTGLCLLSRYSMIGFVPFAAVFLLLTKKYRFLIKAIAAGMVTIIVLQIIPFGIKPLLFHLNFPHQYMSAAARVWVRNPEFYYRSLGMAKFFGPSRTESLHYTLIAGTFLAPLTLFAYGKRNLIKDRAFLLAGFQLTITFFYNFLDVSYLYLYYTPVFVSLVIAAWMNTGLKQDS